MDSLIADGDMMNDQLVQIIKAGHAEADACSLRGQFLTSAVILGLLQACKVLRHQLDEQARKPITPEGGDVASSVPSSGPDAVPEPPAP